MSMRSNVRRTSQRPAIWLGTGMAAALASLVWSACTGTPQDTVIYADAPNTITFAPRATRFVRAVTSASSAQEPCIDELEVLEEGTGRNVALADAGARATASSCLEGYAAHRVAHLNDGRYGNGHSWIAASAKAGEWAQIELPQPVVVSAVVFSRDREGRYADRVPLNLTVLVSVDGETWEQVADVYGQLARDPSGAAARSIPIPLQHARFVRLHILGTADCAPPALDEIAVYGRDTDRNLASPREGGSVTVSSAGSGGPQLLNDGAYGPASRWQASRARDQWVIVRLAQRTEVTRMGFRSAGPEHSGRPSVFACDISLDGSRWKTVYREGWPDVPVPPLAGGTGALAADATAPTSDADRFPNLARIAAARVRASSVIAGFPDIHRVEHLNDGRYGNSRSWVAAASPAWVELDFGEPMWVFKVAFGSDATGAYRDRAATSFRILAGVGAGTALRWKPVLTRTGHPGVSLREEFLFTPVRTQRLRLEITATVGGSCRIDELEAYGSPLPVPPTIVAGIAAREADPSPAYARRLQAARQAEEYAWLKTYGRADLDPALTDYIRVWDYPEREGEDELPLPELPGRPDLTADAPSDVWNLGSAGTARVADVSNALQSPLVEQSVTAGVCAGTLYLRVHANRLLSRHLCVLSAGDWSGCGVVVADRNGLRFDQYGRSAEASPERLSSVALPGHLDFQEGVWMAAVPLSSMPRWRTYGIRVGLGLGGRHTSFLGRGVLFVPSPLAIRVEGGVGGTFLVRVTNRSPAGPEALKVASSSVEQRVVVGPGSTRPTRVPAAPGPIGPEATVRIADSQGNDFIAHVFTYRPLQRVADLLQATADRLSRRGLDVAAERRMVERCRRRLATSFVSDQTEHRLMAQARDVKRRLMLRDPDLARITRILCVRRHNYEPSHNYSDLFDATGGPGGSLDLVTLPTGQGRLVPERASVRTLCQAGGGVIRDASASYDARTVYFAWRKRPGDYFHLMRVAADGSGVKQMTSGPYHDVYPTPLPDGDLAFISTRCRARYLCWRPQAYVLFRLRRSGAMTPLSYANLSEWAPSVMRDGRILWTRSEYQDKGADFSHTLWAVRPDGSHAELIFGNTILQPNGYANGRQVPESSEVICTLISHFGDLNGPLAVLDPDRSPFEPAAIHTLTPEVPRPGLWPSEECFREPEPISRDVFLCSHAPGRRFGIWLIDRDGNREMLFEDPVYSITCPIPFGPRRRPTPPSTLAGTQPEGEFVLTDVYRGLGSSVARGSVKWLRICQEVRANLERDGTAYRSDHPDFMDWYATPTHLVSGPFGWPSFVAKASWGLVPVAPDGSARFAAPAGKVLYFSILDADLNEIQRMRSVVQLTSGERRGCIGCHESRGTAPPAGVRPRSMIRSKIMKSPWDGRPFWFERDVQPVLNRNCVRCHDVGDRNGIVLAGRPDAHLVPASYRTLVEQGWVHYFDWGWNSGGNEKASPLTFGSARSRLWKVLAAGHHGVRLSGRDQLCLKTWTDLNCPLWGDYQHRPERARAAALSHR